MTTLSVIIPFYEDLPSLLKCINTLSASGVLGNELLIQDDASPSVTLDDILNPQIWQRNPVNLGFAGNCNAGAARANGDVLLFLNQDTYAGERSRGWDAAIVRAFENPKVGIAGARLLFPDGRVQSVGGLFDAKGQPFHRCFGYLDPDYEDCAQRRAVSWVTGAALAIRRDLFVQLGGFDTAYKRGYFEDADLCVRAQLAGFEVWYEPDSTLYHRVGTSGGNPEYFRQNMHLFKRRWVDSGCVKPDVQMVYQGWW